MLSGGPGILLLIVETVALILQLLNSSGEKKKSRKIFMLCSGPVFNVKY